MDFSKLRGKIYEVYGSIAAFAKALGRSRQSVDYKLNGRSDFSRRDMDLWMDLLGIDYGSAGEYFFTKNVTKT